MLGYIETVHTHIPVQYIYISRQERLAQTKLMLANIRAVLALFGFSEMSLTDSVQCKPGLVRSERIVLLCSFKARSVLLRSFFKFWRLMRPKRTMISFAFFS